MNRSQVVSVMLSAVVTACAAQAPKGVPEVIVEAQRLPDPPRPVSIVEVPKPMPLPGQLKPAPTEKPMTPEAADPQARVVRANTLARVEPMRANYLNATQVWPYSPDALYQIYASPEKITDIALEAGEELISVSAGDTVRWVIGDTTSGEGEKRHVHILVKPVRDDLHTNLVINSDKRTYHLELTSTPTTWMASVSWQYPLDQLITLKAANDRAQVKAPIADGLALDHLNFQYDITGDAPTWRPLRAFDDGEKVYIQFPKDIAEGDLPPLFVLGIHGAAELVNYRVHAPYYIVDRLFTAAELRLGGKHEQRVRIARLGESVHASAVSRVR